jgi:hypothetical protein
MLADFDVQQLGQVFGPEQLRSRAGEDFAFMEPNDLLSVPADERQIVSDE